MKSLILNILLVSGAWCLGAQYLHAKEEVDPCSVTEAQFKRAYLNQLTGELFDTFDTESQTDPTEPGDPTLPPPTTGDGYHNENEWNAMLAHLTDLYPWFANCDHFKWESVGADGLVSKKAAKGVRNSNVTTTYQVYRDWHNCDESGGGSIGGGSVGSGSTGGQAGGQQTE